MSASAPNATREICVGGTRRVRVHERFDARGLSDGFGTACGPRAYEQLGERHAWRTALSDEGPVELPQQGALFDAPGPVARDEHVGYRGPTACSAAGITYRQLDYWARTGLVCPSVRSATGSGTQRLYSFKDILVLKVVKRLLDTGVSLQNIRVAVDALRSRGVDDLGRITLLSDGTTVYECTSAEEVVDLLRGGQGVFGIAVSGALRELVGSLAHLPSERADGSAEGVSLPGPAADEFSQRRHRRSATG
jgi:DNA-binding transcriptional MerR regulator